MKRLVVKLLFAGADGDVEEVGLRREGTSGEFCISAGRVGGAVEVQIDESVLWSGGVEESSGSVGLISAGEIVEVEEEGVWAALGFQAIRVAVYCERDISGIRDGRGVAEHVGDEQGLGRGIGRVFGLEVEVLADGIPVETSVLFHGPAVGVEDADAGAGPSFDDLEGDLAGLDVGGV